MSEPSMSLLLEVRDIHTVIGQFHILEGVSVEVPPGTITVLLGRNGAGKTTTLKSVLGLTPPRSGQICFAGQEIHGRRPYDIAALGIGFVPEHRAIFRDLSVRENLRIAERRRGDFARCREKNRCSSSQGARFCLVRIGRDVLDHLLQRNFSVRS